MASQFPRIDLSRRDFLKLSALGAGSLLLNRSRLVALAANDQQGRVIPYQISLFEKPTFESREIGVLWKDTVFPILEATVGEGEPEYNHIWYFNGSGYAHSGQIQPVRTQLNTPQTTFPETGALAEVSVPFTDAFWGPGKDFLFAYRFFYATVYWVTAAVLGSDGALWYQIQDDKWDDIFYVLATHLRLIDPAELQPLSADLPADAKRIEVHTGMQLVIAYEWDQPVFMARAATGAKFSNGPFYTPTGRHQTFHKRPTRHMAAGNLAANGYDLPGVPWTSYITEAGVAFHGTYWHNDYGRPRSHGCINLTPQAAKWIYLWSLPQVPPGEQFVYEDFGTRVDVL